MFKKVPQIIQQCLAVMYFVDIIIDGVEKERERGTKTFHRSRNMQLIMMNIITYSSVQLRIKDSLRFFALLDDGDA